MSSTKLPCRLPNEGSAQSEQWWWRIEDQTLWMVDRTVMTRYEQVGGVGAVLLGSAGTLWQF